MTNARTNDPRRVDEDVTPTGRPRRRGDVRTPRQSVGDETKVPLDEATWRREGTDAPDAADIADPKAQL